MSPEPCNLVHSTIAWSLRHIRIRYRRDDEQYNTTRSLQFACGKRLHRFVTMAADADLIERMSELVNNRNFSSVFVPSIGVQYNVGEEKGKLLHSLKKNYSYPYTTYNVYPFLSLSSTEIVSSYKVNAVI